MSARAKAWTVVLVLAWSGFTAACQPAMGIAPEERPGEGVVSDGDPPQGEHSDQPTGDGTLIDWPEIVALIEDQQYQKALDGLHSLRPSLDPGSDPWMRSVVREAQLTIGLHGYERAVRFLLDLEPPPDPTAESTLELLRANALYQYWTAYSWEIQQREKVASDKSLDPKAWTSGQILDRISGAYERLWSQRDEWGTAPVDDLWGTLQPNSYPKEVRGTLRDALTYLWVEFLANSAHWSPAESNELFRVRPAALLDDAPSDPAHPIERLALVLHDLEAWHREGGRNAAALEARLELVRKLHGAFVQEPDRQAIVEHLEGRLAEAGGNTWWSMGQGLLAELVKQSPDADALVRALVIAREGIRVDPDGPGGQWCRAIAQEIRTPDFYLESMKSDASGRDSLRVQHKNLGKLFFRAYAVDLRKRILAQDDYNLLPNYREIEGLVKNSQPIAQWAVELPATPDFRMHYTFVEPPLDHKGLVVVVASAREDFRLKANRRAAVSLLLTDLVLVEHWDRDRWEVQTLSGTTGRPLANVDVELVAKDYQRGHRVLARRTSGANGLVVLQQPAKREQQFLLLGSTGEDLAWVDSYGRREYETESPRSQQLVFTDRSIYRPGQEILWKVVSYERDPYPRFRTLPGHKLTVQLRDPNREVAAETSLETNQYGTASGRFTIPEDRLLGNWTIDTSTSSASVRVEEYKRPTFEVEIAEPEEALRLNRKATLGGEARYYFGLPVTDAPVRWSVHREPVWPRWWWGYQPRTGTASQVVASGESSLDGDGHFEIDFLPEADERQAQQGVTFRFRLHAEVTDPGGETRSAERVFRLGFAAVEAQVTGEPFAPDDEPVVLEVLRTDLDGNARSGTGEWKLHRLVEPAATALPAELPVFQPADDSDRFHTPGDLRRPRWAQLTAAREILREWSTGEVVATGTIEHDDEGLAEVRPGRLSAGSYRLLYSTLDAFGTTIERDHDFVVTGDAALPMAAVLHVDSAPVAVGGTVRVLVHSGLADQEMTLQVLRPDRPVERRVLQATEAPQWLEFPIEREDRGGLAFQLSLVREHQLMVASAGVFVPWDDRRLDLEFLTLRDKLRPGTNEKWTVKVAAHDETALTAGAAELLAYMYDRSLDFFGPHHPPRPLGLYRGAGWIHFPQTSVGQSHGGWHRGRIHQRRFARPTFRQDAYSQLATYGIGGPGRGGPMRRMMAMSDSAALESAPMSAQAMRTAAVENQLTAEASAAPPPEEKEARTDAPPPELRSDFSETAFWEPHLVTGEDGTVEIEFEVPDSVTEWNVWVHAITNDLRSGSIQNQVRTTKELLVRPYLPRFLREGDRAEVRVTVQNTGEETLVGSLDFELFDPATETDVAAEFGLANASGVAFQVAPGGTETLHFELTAPSRVGEVGVRAVGSAESWSDGELRSIPLLPGRIHLAQSRFAALRGNETRTLQFDELAADDDPTRIDEQMVVTVDGQLLVGVLAALPYLANYPYECTEQTLNRFLSAGIVSSLFDRQPDLAKLAKDLSEREEPLQPWILDDPNRRMALVETPWLNVARGGEGEDVLNLLRPRVVQAERRRALKKLSDAQTASGGFPWWPGGPPSPYMTVYILGGLSRALEFDIEVPQEMVVKAWRYLHRHYIDELVDEMVDGNCCWETVTALSYLLSNYPNEQWTGGLFEEKERRKMLDFSFDHWRLHSPRLKGYLALALTRAGRGEDAEKVWQSVMDSAKTDDDLGTYWAPEDRAWLWYNDTIETHAQTLATVLELTPDDPRRHGLVQWLFLNRKLNHWKSTRATAEALYSLVRYMEEEGALGQREQIDVRVADRQESFVFDPTEYTGRNRQLVVEGEALSPESATITVEQQTAGMAFASATWHFSTEELPAESESDFFAVERSYFRRVLRGDDWELEPLAEGASIAVGDQIEVHLSLRTRHAAEFVHLRDPRPAGLEPELQRSQYRWNLGIGWYEEVRDSGTNFFFDRLPVGEYPFRYRLRAAAAGRFRAAPAVVQSMYAPEFVAYSAGEWMTVAADPGADSDAGN